MKHTHRTVGLSIIAALGALATLTSILYLPFQISNANPTHNIAINATSKNGFDGQPLEKMLNPDGSLNLLTGFSGSLDVKGWQMEHAPDDARVGERVLPVERHAASGGLEQPREDVHQRALAGAVGAEQPEEPRRDVQRDALERRDGTGIDLDEVTDLQHGGSSGA